MSHDDADPKYKPLEELVEVHFTLTRGAAKYLAAWTWPDDRNLTPGDDVYHEQFTQEAHDIIRMLRSAAGED